jgi:hypothetical protein
MDGAYVILSKFPVCMLLFLNACFYLMSDLQPDIKIEGYDRFISTKNLFVETVVEYVEACLADHS